MGELHPFPMMLALDENHNMLSAHEQQERQHPNTPSDPLPNQDLFPSHLDSFSEAGLVQPSQHKAQRENDLDVSVNLGSRNQTMSELNESRSGAGQGLSVSFVGDPSTPRSHRRLYTHHTNSRNISIDNQPMMLLPKARLHDEKRDLLRAGRAFGVMPQTGLEHLQLSAISAASGWIGVKDDDGWASPAGSRPVTAFKMRTARTRERSKEGSRTPDTSVLAAHRPSTAHPLTTRRGKMAAMFERLRSSGSSRSDGSTSADSGIGSTRRSTLDKCTCDVINSRFMDDILKHSSQNGASASDTFQTSEDDSDIRHKNGELHEKDSVISSESHVQDYAHAQDDDTSLPEHLDSFDDVAQAMVEQIRNRKKKSASVEDSVEDDVFDDRWHSGHDDSETCPYCKEFERATKGRVDRYFGGAESFLDWIFSKWGKRRELEGMTRSKFKLHSRMPHFCNFVHSVNLHQRYSDSGGGPGRGSSASDDDNRLGSMGSEPTDKDLLAQWRKQSRFTPSGTEGRPGSPSSMVDGQNVLDPNTLVNGRMSEDEDVDKLSAKMIPTITIPSSPIPPADQGAGTQRSSGEDSPRKSAKEKPKEPTRQPISAPKPKPLPTSKPAAPKDKAPGADTPPGSAKGKRLPVAKKTKKGSDRKRKGKSSEMEEAQPAPAASGDASGEVAVDQPPAQPAEVDLKVPDLPDFPASGKDKGKSPRKGDKHTISSPLGVGDAKPQLPPELLELTQRNGYDFGDMEDTINETAKPKFRSHSWLNNRMALSQQASRFELPMDMKSLEKMTTQEYLKKYCIVTSRRLNLYQKIFMKHKDKSNHITRAGLETCLKEVLVETLKENTLADLCDVLEVTDETQIDFKLFSGIAAIAERILYPYYTTEDTLEKAEYQREKIETADFGALDWKLNGVSITDNMRKLLKMIE